MKSNSGVLRGTVKTMLIVVMVLFVAAVFSTQSTYAATNDVKDQGNFKGLNWKTIEKSDGSYELQLGGKSASGEDGNTFTGSGGGWNNSSFDSGRMDFIEEVHEGTAESKPQNAYYESKKKAMNAYPWNTLDYSITSVKIIADVQFVGNINYMFAGLEDATAFIDLNRIDTSEVINVRSVFGYGDYHDNEFLEEHAVKAKTIDISEWDLSKVQDACRIFECCRDLEIVDMSQVKCKPDVCAGVFNGCTNLRTVKIGSGFDTSASHAVGEFFALCESLETLDVSWFKPDSADSLYHLFYNCKNLRNITGMNNWNTENLISIQWMFAGCSKLTNVGEQIKNWNTSSVSLFNGIFYLCESMTGEIDLSKWDTRNAEQMFGTFAGAGFSKINLTGWDTSHVTTMAAMFYTPLVEGGRMNTNLEEIIGLDGFNTSRVTKMERMFTGSSKLTSLKGVESWDVSNVTNLYSTFRETGIENLNLSAWDTMNVTNLREMVRDCVNLNELDLTGWNVKKVDDLALAFRGCSELVKIYGLDTWDTGNTTDMYGTFARLGNLETTDMLEFDSSSATDMGAFLLNTPKIKKALQDKAAEASDNGEPDKAAAYTEVVSALDEFNSKSGSEKLASFKRIANAYAKAVFGDVEAAADELITAAEEAELAAKDPNASADDKAAAKAALKAATDATNRVSKLAKNSVFDGSDDPKAEALQNRLAGVETDQKGRLTDILQSGITEAKNINTADNSATSAKALERAIANAENVLGEENSTAADIAKATEVLNNAVSNLAPKSTAEKAYDAAVAKLNEAVGESNSAKEAYEAAKAKADDEKAKDPGSAEAIKAAEDAKAAAEQYAEKAGAAKAAADEAKTAAIATSDFDLRKAASNKANETNNEKKAADRAVNEAENALSAALSANTEAAYNAVKTEYENAKKKADEEFKKDPGSDAAVKAAEEAEKAALNWLNKAKTVYGENSPQAKEAQAAVDAARELLAKVRAAYSSALVGKTFIYGKNIYKITVAPGDTWDGEVTFIKAKNKRSVAVPKTVKYQKKTYEVNRVGTKAFRAKKIRKVTIGANVEKINAKAFQKSKAKTLVIKTKYLTKKRVKGSLKGSKITTVKVKVGSKKANKKYVKKYKKIFTKKNAGKKVKVKR